MTRVYTSSVIDAPRDQVWAAIRDFNGLPDWHPAIAESEIEKGRPADQIGCIRHFKLQDGGVIREQLLTLSDDICCCTYSILESPMGVRNYKATLASSPRSPTAIAAFAEWTADFDCDADAEAGLIELIGTGVFQGGFDSLKKRFG